MVRVLRLWKLPAFLNSSETNSIEMMLVDEKGGNIHASIRKQFLYMFQSKIEEDFMGLMTGISAEKEYVRDGKITKMVVVELTDSSGKCECALFGDYVDDITKKLGKSSSGLPIVVIQFAKVKIFRDQASIQNVINTTKILVNPDIPEAEVFKNSIVLHGIDMDTTVPMIGGRAKPPMEEEFLKMYQKKRVADLNDMDEEGIFAVYGFVTAIVDGQEWWYPVCSKCKLRCLMPVSNDGSFPAEFKALVGKKMLFIIDKGMKQMKIVDGTFRVKRVCSDPKIIESFAEEGDCFTPVKAMTPVFNVDSDDGLDDLDFVDDSQSLLFIKDIIVTPPDFAKQSAEDDDVVNTVKRNLTEVFDVVAKEGKRKPGCTGMLMLMITMSSSNDMASLQTSMSPSSASYSSSTTTIDSSFSSPQITSIPSVYTTDFSAWSSGFNSSPSG
ncbi:replication factor A protein [Trifolium pratense]|uniref:Replication factor A protein n=1 Tax=Trifolium pratense TaxID=57577 RepID=A0A2K3N423_TRIPR|nr:replication factor A protein [Trifolium pratense]